MSMTSLIDWRLSEQLDQYAAAFKLGISQSTVSKYETGERKPSPKTARKIEKITGVPKEFLRPDLWGRTAQ